MTVLELRSISRVYGRGAAQVQALRDISLSVAAGSMVAVMGPSGSGKSTLLTISGTLEEPTSGAVLVGGQDVARMPGGARARLRRRAIGYVFQDFNLLPGLTAAENVSLPLELDGMSARRAHLAGIRALEDLGLAGQARRFPDQLSGGERQRVAIARAVAACLAALAWAHSSLTQTFGNVPWPDIGLLVIGMPLAGAAAGWLLGGREPAAVARQPLE